MHTETIIFTDAQLIQLASHPLLTEHPELSQAVDAAMLRSGWMNYFANLTQEEASFCSLVVQKAPELGKLVYQHKQIRSCGVCQKWLGYYKFKKGMRKGKSDYNRPLYMSGIELKPSFVSMQGHASMGCCSECMKKMLPSLKKALATAHAELPAALILDTGQQQYRQVDVLECQKCQWKDLETKAGKLTAMMGGHYPGKCPDCGAENNLFGPIALKTVDSAVIEVLPPAAPEPKDSQ